MEAQGFIEYMKKYELDAAKVRNAAHKIAFKKKLKEMPFGIKIWMLIRYIFIRQIYKVKSNAPLEFKGGMRVQKVRYIKARNMDAAIIKFHKKYKYETLGKIEAWRN